MFLALRLDARWLMFRALRLGVRRLLMLDGSFCRRARLGNRTRRRRDVADRLLHRSQRRRGTRRNHPCSFELCGTLGRGDGRTRLIMAE